MDKITLIAPDDWHCHFRDEAFLQRTVHDSALRFKRAIAMPNLKPPVIDAGHAALYRERIIKAAATLSFDPLMTLYLCTETTEQIIREAASSNHVAAVKLYPAGVTTNSKLGIQKISDSYHLLAVMEECDFPLLVHGESNNLNVDVFDREAVFIEEELAPLVQHFPKLRIVLEHISTKAAVDFVKASADTIAATITPHHLLLNRNHMLDEGIRPHYYCKPILKREQDQSALIQAAISGNPKFFLGTDSAPHSIHNTESDCGCAGVYSAHAALEIYAEVFDIHDALTKLENFASVFGAQFYKLPVNLQTITLHKKTWTVPLTLQFGNEELVPLLAGENLHWQIEGVNYP